MSKEEDQERRTGGESYGLVVGKEMDVENAGVEWIGVK